MPSRTRTLRKIHFMNIGCACAIKNPFNKVARRACKKQCKQTLTVGDIARGVLRQTRVAKFLEDLKRQQAENLVEQQAATQ